MANEGDAAAPPYRRRLLKSLIARTNDAETTADEPAVSEPKSEPKTGKDMSDKPVLTLRRDRASRRTPGYGKRDKLVQKFRSQKGPLSSHMSQESASEQASVETTTKGSNVPDTIVARDSYDTLDASLKSVDSYRSGDEGEASGSEQPAKRAIGQGNHLKWKFRGQKGAPPVPESHNPSSPPDVGVADPMDTSIGSSMSIDSQDAQKRREKIRKFRTKKGGLFHSRAPSPSLERKPADIPPESIDSLKSSGSDEKEITAISSSVASAFSGSFELAKSGSKDDANPGLESTSENPVPPMVSESRYTTNKNIMEVAAQKVHGDVDKTPPATDPLKPPLKGVERINKASDANFEATDEDVEAMVLQQLRRVESDEPSAAPEEDEVNPVVQFNSTENFVDISCLSTEESMMLEPSQDLQHEAVLKETNENVVPVVDRIINEDAANHAEDASRTKGDNFEATSDDICDAMVQRQLDSLEESEDEGDNLGDMVMETAGQDGSVKANSEVATSTSGGETPNVVSHEVPQQGDEGKGEPTCSESGDMTSAKSVSEKSLREAMREKLPKIDTQLLNEDIQDFKQVVGTPPPPPPPKRKRSKRNRPAIEDSSKAMTPRSSNKESPALDQAEKFSNLESSDAILTPVLSMSPEKLDGVPHKGSSFSTSTSADALSAESVSSSCEIEGMNSDENLTGSPPPPPPPYKLLAKLVKRRRKKKAAEAAKKSSGSTEGDWKHNDSAISANVSLDHSHSLQSVETHSLSLEGNKGASWNDQEEDPSFETLFTATRQEAASAGAKTALGRKVKASKDDKPFDEGSSVAGDGNPTMRKAAGLLLDYQLSPVIDSSPRNKTFDDDGDIPMITQASNPLAESAHDEASTTQHNTISEQKCKGLAEPSDEVLDDADTPFVQNTPKLNEVILEDTITEPNSPLNDVICGPLAEAKLALGLLGLPANTMEPEDGSAEHVMDDEEPFNEKIFETPEMGARCEILQTEHRSVDMIQEDDGAANNLGRERDHDVKSASANDSSSVVPDKNEFVVFIVSDKSEDPNVPDHDAIGWDTRSVVENPPEISPNAVPDIDSSWDASRIVFDSDFKEAKEENEHEDSWSWAKTVSDFSDGMDTAAKKIIKIDRWTQSARDTSQVELGISENFSAARSDLVTEDGWPSIEELESDDAKLDEGVLPSKDDEALLANDGRSDVHDPLEDASELHQSPSQKERLESYNNISADYISSSDESAPEEDEIKNESDDDEIEVAYQAHDTENGLIENEDGERLFFSNSFEEKPFIRENDAVEVDINNKITDSMQDDFATFDAANFAANFANDAITPQTTHALGKRDESCSKTINVILTESSPCNVVKANATDVSLRAIPLLAPPPEEKMKKWEESKLRPFKVFKAMKEKKIDDDSTSKMEPFLGQVESPDKATTAVGKRKTPLVDDKMAEKAALVSSAAAQMFERTLLAEQLRSTRMKADNGDPSSLMFCGGNEVVAKELCSAITPSDTETFDESNQDKTTSKISSDRWTSPSSEGRPEYTTSLVDIASNDTIEEASPTKQCLITADVLAVWLRCLVLKSDIEEKKVENSELELRLLLLDDNNFDSLCALAAAKVSATVTSETCASSPFGKVKEVVPFSLSGKRQRPEVLAANFASFVQRIGKLTGVESPFKDENPFVLLIVTDKMAGKNGGGEGSMQSILFANEGSDPVQLTRFFYNAIQSATRIAVRIAMAKFTPEKKLPDKLDKLAFQEEARSETYVRRFNVAPVESPSPFEKATWTLPSAVVILLGYLGDPVAVCRLKIVNRFCNRIIAENEHAVMRDAVRLGGMSMNVRPAFWMWITLDKFHSKRQQQDSQRSLADMLEADDEDHSELSKLAAVGREGKWHGVIERDVARAFGNFPPHKTGARLRHDSIVRALITYGRGRLIKRGVKGGGELPPIPSIASMEDIPRRKTKPRVSTAPPPWERGDEDSDGSETPTDTVSDWGGVSPVASFAESLGEDAESKRQLQRREAAAIQEPEKENVSVDASRDAVEELVLNGNALTSEMKTKLQSQLELILHALAAQHEDVGYCQGLDYVVAHLLRVLQETVVWHAARGCLPKAIRGTEMLSKHLPDITDKQIEKSLVVEEAVFRVVDCLFTTYNLRHMYWPELRSLKICCRVFERLIKHKLPVLADHFEHHELNVGLFALGWFQTLFLYLPSMPTATVCHMWDIWLVERSLKIFFRVGTAILFLSQPILLNHDLEGMMTYLNTFPDATLLKSDILIACALQIKVTNSMLTELETEVTGGI